MSSWGTTSITVTGPQADRAALHAALAATATDTFAFSLSRAAPDVWCADGLLRNADMAETGDALHLKVCMAHDGSCVALAGSLARRYPALRFEAWFDSEDDWPNFTAAAHEGGAEIYHAWFETTHLASVVIDPADPRCCSAIPFYQRTPERDLAAASSLGDCLDILLRRPELVAGWRRSDDSDNTAVYIRRDADDGGHLVLVVDGLQETLCLLHNVNTYGGYSHVEPLSLDQVRIQMPELAAEIDKALLEAAADRVKQLAWHTENFTVAADDCEIPF